MGNIGQKLWDILRDILVKYWVIYLAKQWDILFHWIYLTKLMDVKVTLWDI